MVTLEELVEFTAISMLLDDNIVSIKFRLENFAKEYQAKQLLIPCVVKSSCECDKQIIDSKLFCCVCDKDIE